jgi:hypothetical protein
VLLQHRRRLEDWSAWLTGLAESVVKVPIHLVSSIRRENVDKWLVVG